MDYKVKAITFYKSLWCNVFSNNYGKYIMLHKSVPSYQQPVDFWEHSFKVGFDEAIPGKHCLFAVSYNDFIRTKHIDTGIAKGFFELEGRTVYALEVLMKPYNVPRYFQMTEKDYDKEFTIPECIGKVNEIKSQNSFCDGYRNSGNNFFSLYDIKLEMTVPVLKEGTAIEHTFKKIKRSDGTAVFIAAFTNTKYEMLSYFFTYEMEKCKDYIVDILNASLTKPYNHFSINSGMMCVLDIAQSRTIIDCPTEVDIGAACFISTADFKILVEEWLNLVNQGGDKGAE